MRVLDRRFCCKNIGAIRTLLRLLNFLKIRRCEPEVPGFLQSCVRCTIACLYDDVVDLLETGVSPSTGKFRIEWTYLERHICRAEQCEPAVSLFVHVQSKSASSLEYFEKVM